MSRRFLFPAGLGAAPLLVIAAASVAVAQRSSPDSASKSAGAVAQNQPAGKQRKLQNPMALTPAREAAAMTFAQLYHEELAKLLTGLKKRNKKAYRRAVRQLYLDSERLARIKEQNPQRYELALRTWKLDSRIRLLAAKVLLVKNPDPKLETQLRDALRERVDLRIQRSEMDRDRLVRRLQTLNNNIAKWKEDPEKAAQLELAKVKRSLGIRPKRSRKRKTVRRKAK